MKTTHEIIISQDSGRTVAWQVKHHVAHMFLYNHYQGVKPRKYHPARRTISWLHFSDPNIDWKVIKQEDFLRTKNNTAPIKSGNAWKTGFEPNEIATIMYVKSLQISAGIGNSGTAMVSAGLKPCGEPCRCSAGRSKHLDAIAADLNRGDLRQLSASLSKAEAETLDEYLKRFGLHRPLLNHGRSSEPWHIEALN